MPDATVPVPDIPARAEAAPTPALARPAPPDRVTVWAARLSAWRHDPRAGALLLALVAVAAGVLWYRSGTSAGATSGATGPEVASVPSATATAAAPTTLAALPAELVVHVAGAVRAPGIVHLEPGARVVDALDAAGGPADGADLDRLNLAAPVVDGQRVAVPRVGEPTPAAEPSASATGTASPASGPLDLNAASRDELEALPGIGPALAQAILDERTRRNGFTSVDDLKRVRGIGEQRFAQLRDLVTV